MSEHVTNEDVRRFRGRQLDRVTVEKIGAHVRECADCAARIWSAGDVRAAVDGMAVDATRDEEKTRRRMPGWLAVAAAIIPAAIGLAAWVALRPQPVPAVPPVVVVKPTPRTHSWDAVVADARKRGAVDRPAWLADLAPPREVVRGPEDDAGSVRLLAPVGAGVESQVPEFRWTARNGAKYEVRIVRGRDVIATSGPIDATTWKPSRPLPRDARYEWQLLVRDGDRTWLVPSGEERPAMFRVIGESEAESIAAARADGDALATGVLAARAGVVDEALRALARSSDPAAARIAAGIRAWSDDFE